MDGQQRDWPGTILSRPGAIERFKRLCSRKMVRRRDADESDRDGRAPRDGTRCGYFFWKRSRRARRLLNGQGLFDLEFFDAFAQGGAGYAQQFGGLHLIALGFQQGLND